MRHPSRNPLSPRPLSVALLCAVIIPTTGAQAVQTPPSPSPVFGAQVGLVSVDVVVLDDNDRPVSGLTQADFTVTEDGARQEISKLRGRAVQRGGGGDARDGARVQQRRPAARRPLVRGRVRRRAHDADRREPGPRPAGEAAGHAGRGRTRSPSSPRRAAPGGAPGCPRSAKTWTRRSQPQAAPDAGPLLGPHRPTGRRCRSTSAAIPSC